MFAQITETDEGGNVKQAFSLSSLNFTCSNIVSNSVTDSVNCGGQFPNTALINITAALSKTNYNVTFAGDSFTVAPNTVKISITLQYWPFRSIRNNLTISISTQGINSFSAGRGSNIGDCQSPQTTESDSESPSEFGSGSNGNLRWFSLRFGTSTLYGTFNDKAEIEGKPKYTNVGYDSNSSRIYLQLPYFWQYAIIDPNFAVLVDDFGTSPYTSSSDSCIQGNNPKVPVSVIVGIVIGVVASVVIAAAAVYLLRKHRKRQNRKKLETLYSATDSNGTLRGGTIRLKK